MPISKGATFPNIILVLPGFVKGEQAQYGQKGDRDCSR
jgi:hypothetical protein